MCSGQDGGMLSMCEQGPDGALLETRSTSAAAVPEFCMSTDGSPDTNNFGDAIA